MPLGCCPRLQIGPDSLNGWCKKVRFLAGKSARKAIDRKAIDRKAIARKATARKAIARKAIARNVIDR